MKFTALLDAVGGSLGSGSGGVGAEGKEGWPGSKGELIAVREVGAGAALHPYLTQRMMQ